MKLKDFMKQKYLLIICIVLCLGLGVGLSFCSNTGDDNEPQRDEWILVTDNDDGIENDGTENHKITEDNEITENDEITENVTAGESAAVGVKKSSRKKSNSATTNTITVTPMGKPTDSTTDTDTTTDSTTDTTTDTDTTTPDNIRPGILDTGIVVDDTGALRYIPNSAIEEQLMQEIYFFQDKLLTSVSSYDSDTSSNVQILRLLSMDTGEVLYEVSIPNVAMTATQICGNQIAVIDAQNGKIYVLNEKLEKVNEYFVQGNKIYVNTTLTEAYCFTNISGSEYELCAVKLESGEVTSILKDVYDLYPSASNGNSVSMGYIDAATGWQSYAGLNLETGELEELGIKASFYSIEYDSGCWMGGLLSDENYHLFGTQAEPYKFKVTSENSMINLLGEPSRIMITDYEADGSVKMSVYAADGALLSNCTLKDVAAGPNSDPAWSEAAGGYFFTATDKAGHDLLYFWDLSADGAEQDNLDLIPYYEDDTPSGGQLPQEYYERAKALSEKCGAKIKIAEQCLTEYEGMVAEQILDEAQIETGLDVVEKALSSYPDGFFGQLYYGSYLEMEINLMGDITWRVPIEGHEPAAFVTEENNKIIMVLDITFDAEILEQNFYHETSHIIDAKLEAYAKYNTDAVYSEEAWNELNPEGFPGYYLSYGTLPNEYYAEEFSLYFVDDYSMTFPTEDRARIFEHAMIGNSYYFNENTDGFNGRRAKLDYYCQSIRDGFDTTGWPDVTKWEQALIDSAGGSGGGGKG